MYTIRTEFGDFNSDKIEYYTGYIGFWAKFPGFTRYYEFPWTSINYLQKD